MFYSSSASGCILYNMSIICIIAFKYEVEPMFELLLASNLLHVCVLWKKAMWVIKVNINVYKEPDIALTKHWHIQHDPIIRWEAGSGCSRFHDNNTTRSRQLRPHAASCTCLHVDAQGYQFVQGNGPKKPGKCHKNRLARYGYGEWEGLREKGVALIGVTPVIHSRFQIWLDQSPYCYLVIYCDCVWHVVLIGSRL